MKRILFLCLVLQFLPAVSIGITPYGFISIDHYYDSRQIMGARDNYVLFWPLPILRDRFCQDINAHPGWNMTAIQTRFGVIVEQPWYNTIAKGVIEGDFLGATDASIGTYRMRLGYTLLEGKDWSLMAGQYWHPLFIYTECFPDTISFNNGLPMEPQSRCPQLRFTYHHKSFELMLAACGQNDFTDLGPVGATPLLEQNAVIPNLHMQLRYVHDEILVGAALDCKRLVPRIVTNNNVATHEKVDSFLTELFGAYNAENFQFRSKFVFAQNAADQLMLGGYAVRTVEPFTDIRTYANTQVVAAWLDTAYWFDEHTKSIGLFIGGVKNLGSREPLYIDPATQQPIVFALDPNIDNVWRIAPRFRFIKKPVTIGLELEYTQAAFGNLNRKAVVINPRATGNMRLLFEILYVF